MNRIKLAVPSLGTAEIRAVAAVLRSGWVVHGPKNQELEAALCGFFGVRCAVAVNSGASALQLALMACGLKGEVIIPGFTMSATANAVVAAGLTPVFADVEEDTGNISPSSILDKITRKTAAIMPVHYAGQSCDMDAVMDIAGRRRFKVIEDAAETCGGTWRGKYAGTFGDAGCLSFWASKAITTGEGGAVVTDDPRIAFRARTLSAHGIASTTKERQKSPRPWLRDAVMAGFNYRMSHITAAVGVEQMKKLSELNRLRVRSAGRLRALLSGAPGLSFLETRPEAAHVFQMFIVKVPARVRDRLVTALRARGIEASVHFDPPVHKQTFYRRRFGEMRLPMTERLAKTVVTLPLFPDMTVAQIERVAWAVKAGLRRLL